MQVKTGSLITGDCSQFGGTRSHSFLLLLLRHGDTMLHKFSLPVQYVSVCTLSCTNTHTYPSDHTPYRLVLYYNFHVQRSFNARASPTPRFLIIQQQQLLLLFRFISSVFLHFNCFQKTSVARYSGLFFSYIYIYETLCTEPVHFFGGRGSKLKE